MYFSAKGKYTTNLTTAHLEYYSSSHLLLSNDRKPVQSHIGNMRFANLLEEHMESYFATSKRKEKGAVVQLIIQ